MDFLSYSSSDDTEMYFYYIYILTVRKEKKLRAHVKMQAADLVSRLEIE